MDNRIHIIGIGDDGPRGLSAASLQRIDGAGVLVGGERHLAMFPEAGNERIVLKGGLMQTVERLISLREQSQVIVLASGDPLFYGIAGFIAKKAGADAVCIHPHLSSIQLAFSKMGESWQDAVLESVHGRPIKGLAQRIDGKAKVALLTDETNSPAAIAAYLLDFGMDEYDAFVAENLGGEDERYGWWSLADMAAATFAPLNVVVLRRRLDAAPMRRHGFGFEDHEFDQRKPDKGLITKKEVRVLSLAELKLKLDSIVWDIGAGSGSVGVECARLAPLGQVFALEKNEGDLVNITNNSRKFRADITAIHAKAPNGLDGLPDPDAVFIGGSGGELRELIRICCTRLNDGGRIVVNAATIETLATAQSALRENGFDANIALVQISRSKPILDMTRFEGLNPIYVITGSRGNEAVQEAKGNEE
ncbi:precorrin-6y C5,15-methyltransferase (decarboxylating) subunit CbiE [Paenibacillus sp. MMS18-CY102]|uniref:precorrin-6y C5,15-methyltransferase (decarboxylating) subunit CbiE n=1 Tax=Paenibacillus sp. MMS18-CY102 TaxID=2682849 RepID=UPI001365257B|nr:precorrin-6y C5,15-methyltransferase (decarboxylating) subunit CbiE [Paenibacillus sp. MMS18-CY102]MWC30619.1 precorrin-6y C5,15-methyltransferase (decarboxylating) subunit CbiE [Paenibacillus sp. MMS18-CY102]